MKKLIILLLLISINNAQAQTPLGEEFSYQGELNDPNGNPHDGVFDFKFVAYDSANDGTGNNLGQFIADDVQVTDGIFTTVIDYSILGDQPFLGNKVWLEISVRIGTTTGGYQQLLPRQQVTATPYANHAVFAELVGANAIGTSEIQNGSIQATDINPAQIQQRVGGSCVAGQFIKSVNQDGTVVCAADDTGLTTVTSAEIVDGTIQAIDLDTTQIQRRISASCAAGEFMQSVNQDGTPVCVAETGGITTVTTTEIVDGTIQAIDIDNSQIQQRVTTVCSGGRVVKSINASGVATCVFPTPSDNSVNSAKVTDGSIAAVDVDSTQIQQRINGSCIFPEYLTSVTQAGDVVCARMGIGVTTILNSIGDGIIYSNPPSIAIGNDGTPVISYYYFEGSTGTGSLKFIKCNNLSCTKSNPVVTLDNTASVGEYNSLAIGSDGNPIISYSDSTNGTLRVVKCATPTCTPIADNKQYTLDSVILADTSIAINLDNNPIISYSTYLGELKVVKCGTPSCSTSPIPTSAINTIITLDSGIGTGFIGKSVSMAIDKTNPMATPIISYYDSTNGDLKVIKCITADCSTSANTGITVDTGGAFNSYNANSLVIGADHNPIISYHDSTDGNLNVLKCSNINCSDTSSSGNVKTYLDSNASYSSIVIGADNNPIISYYEFNEGLKIVKCLSQDCVTKISPQTLDSKGSIGNIAVDTTNSLAKPIISYIDLANYDLKIYSCGDERCSN